MDIHVAKNSISKSQKIHLEKIYDVEETYDAINLELICALKHEIYSSIAQFYREFFCVWMKIFELRD